MSDSVRPHRRQATRLPHPWDSPGKNTGVGCHFLLQSMKVKSESEVAQLCPTLCDPWTVALQAPPSMGFFRQEYWSELPFPSPGDLPNPRIEPRSPTLQADALTSAPPEKPIYIHIYTHIYMYIYKMGMHYSINFFPVNFIAVV